MAATRKRTEPKPINLALQGGGAHGAFSWGVVDRLLEDDRLEIAAVTGASAGAMNAVALAQGFVDGDCEAARAALREFWSGIAEAARTSPIQRTWFDRMIGDWSLDRSPSLMFFDILSRVASPYDLNPLDVNPLRDVLLDLIDFDAVRSCEKMQIFLSATNVETGRAKVFQKDEITVDHVLASACLPFIFKAVEINGTPYWDGGYMGNPPLWPLFEHSTTDDVVIVQINPMERHGAPRSARDILNRLNEITFNASLMRELRSIDFVSRLIDAKRLEGTGYRNVRVHLIGAEENMRDLSASSKLNAEMAFFEMLFELGRETADSWLAANFDALGNQSTIDLRRMFQGDEDALDGSRIDRQAAFQEKLSGAASKPANP